MITAAQAAARPVRLARMTTRASAVANTTAAISTARWSPPSPPYSPHTENGEPRFAWYAIVRA